MAHSASISQTIAGRYAQAVFDIAQEEGALDALASGVGTLDKALADSADLREVISSPVISREDQGRAISALAEKMKLPAALANTLRLMAANRRLFALPQLLARLDALLAEARGEARAEVVSAIALDAAQKDRLAKVLAEKSGHKIRLEARVDPSLIGGMIVKMGSQMIDSSVRSKLASLKNAMKEVG